MLCLIKRNPIEGEIDYLSTIWMKKENELKIYFQNLDMEFTEPQGKSSKLTIKLWNFPIRCLLNASIAEKISYANLLHSRYLNFVSFIEDVDISTINLEHNDSSLQQSESVA